MGVRNEEQGEGVGVVGEKERTVPGDQFASRALAGALTRPR